jgi:hypothetical protein
MGAMNNQHGSFLEHVGEALACLILIVGGAYATGLATLV